MALCNPAVVGWDPPFAYELACIVVDGIAKMFGKDQDLIFVVDGIGNEVEVQRRSADRRCTSGWSPDGWVV